MTFMETHRFAGGRSEKAVLRIAWEGELFGVGMYETLAQMFPDQARELTAAGAMERFNATSCEPFGHAAGLSVTQERAVMLNEQGSAFARQSQSFEAVARIGIEETEEADEIYRHLIHTARTSALRLLGHDLMAHTNALRNWMRSELNGKSDQAEQIYAYLACHGIGRGKT